MSYALTIKTNLLQSLYFAVNSGHVSIIRRAFFLCEIKTNEASIIFIGTLNLIVSGSKQAYNVFCDDEFLSKQMAKIETYFNSPT